MINTLQYKQEISKKLKERAIIEGLLYLELLQYREVHD